jgi:hypothetical protein
MSDRRLAERQLLRVILLMGGALGLASCSTPLGSSLSSSEAPPPAPEVPPAIQASEIIGSWGFAAYHKPDDRQRTEVAARNQCRQPVNIGAGPSGGVMMYLADSSKLEELRMKGAPGNKTFVGPAGEAGGVQDREIVSFDGRVMIMRFVDPEVAGRYGTSVYVRCSPRA